MHQLALALVLTSVFRAHTVALLQLAFASLFLGGQRKRHTPGSRYRLRFALAFKGPAAHLFPLDGASSLNQLGLIQGLLHIKEVHGT